MLVQQSLTTLAPLSVPVIGPVVVTALDLNPGYIGAFVAIIYGTSMISSMVSGGMIARYGAIRLSQVCVLLCGVGLAIAASGVLGLFVLTALLIGLGAGPSTPASSHILARFSPPRLMPLMFSIKQTGVPLGGILAGTMVPYLLGLTDWQGALLITATLYLAMSLILQPLRRNIDDDRDPGRRITIADARRNFRYVIRNRPLRELAIALCIFTGLQLTFGSYFVAYLVDGLGFDLAFAGLAFATGQGAGFIGRIVWGWVGVALVPSRLLLGLLGLVMVICGVLFAMMDSDWSKSTILTLAVIYGVTGIGYQGIHLAEVARHAPKGEAGAITGAVVVFAYAGMTIFPALVGAIVATTGSYGTGFLIAALTVLPVAILFLRRLPAENGDTPSPKDVIHNSDNT